jgi:CubicO group peptidase (beta-lactamase class C family)
LAFKRILPAPVLRVALVALGGMLQAQTMPSPPLTDYVGTYADTPGHPVEIVNGDTFFAVQDEAEYVLIPKGVNAFSTRYGPTLSFQRDSSGKVTEYEQNGKLHPRVSTAISPETAALARPRPLGRNAPADYRYHPPADLNDGIAVGDIAHTDLGIATANDIVRGILDSRYKGVQSVLLYQDRKLVMEEYFYGYDAARTHQLRSATKSVVSALAGIAVDRGALTGVGERVLPQMHYASYAHPDPRKAEINLGDFLSMSSGLDCNDHTSTSPGREEVIDDQPDWVKATLDLPMINVVGRLIENTVRMPLPEFAQNSLFGPLGIGRADWQWNYDLTNADKEYSQIHLRPRDMLKLGILYEDDGRWHGRQIISASWARTSLAEQSQVDNESYGYFWWRHMFHVKTASGLKQIVISAAQGNGGQKIYIAPQYHLVAVFTGSGYNAEWTPPNTIMESIVLPKLMEKGSTGNQISLPQ